jgi:hypothetical protein
MPVKVSVRTVVVRSADRQAADGCVLDAHRQRQESDQGVTAAGTEVLAGDRRDRHRHRGQDELDRDGHSEPTPPVATEAACEAPGRNPAAQEEGERQQRSGHRQTAGPGSGEAEEDNVAGHVGDEDVAEPQVGERVDDAGEDRQHDQEGRQPILLRRRGRPERLCDLPPCGHPRRARRHRLYGSPLAMSSSAWNRAARSRRS